ncbi:Transthyretin-like family protein [Aphelenchoides besseyi]|nr:Transthyretin-like family protein [Aphelenchoides besseyi]
MLELKVSVFFLIFGLIVAEMHYISVKGRIECNGRAERNITVQLWDFDWASLDELLDKKWTDGNGQFELHGQENEWRIDFWKECELSKRKMKAYLEIRHNCNDKRKPMCTIYDFGRQFAKCSKPTVADDLGVIELSKPFFDGKRRQSDGCW